MSAWSQSGPPVAETPREKAPNEYKPGDRMDVRPIGDCVVVESFAIGNYHNDLGWQLIVESPYGRTNLFYTIASLSTEERTNGN